MDLYFLRHAIAVPRETPGCEDDARRPLTPKGEKKMERIAKGMKSLGLSFDFILTSPYLRAKQTAEIVARVFKAGRRIRFVKALAADREPEELIGELKKNYSGKRALLLVGHEPFLSRTISLLLAGSPDISIHLKKGGLCKLTAERLRNGKCAAQEWLLAPRQLVRI